MIERKINSLKLQNKIILRELHFSLNLIIYTTVIGLCLIDNNYNVRMLDITNMFCINFMLVGFIFYLFNYRKIRKLERMNNNGCRTNGIKS